MTSHVVSTGGTVYPLPALADGATSTSSALAWTYGSYAQLDDGSGITADSYIVGVALDTPSAVGILEVEIAQGAGGAEVAVATVKIEVASDAGAIAPVMLPKAALVSAGTRIAARHATKAASADTVGITAILQVKA